MAKISKTQRVWCGVAGGLAGVINGLFGGGGGMALVPLLVKRCGLSQQEAFATSVLIIFPLCALSSVIYCFRVGVDMSAALPYLLGGLAGGFVGGKIFRGASPDSLRKIFALFALYGGVRALL